MNFIITNKPERYLKPNLKLFLVTAYKYHSVGQTQIVVVESRSVLARALARKKLIKRKVEFDFIECQEFSDRDGTYLAGRLKNETNTKYWGSPALMCSEKPRGFTAMRGHDDVIWREI